MAFHLTAPTLAPFGSAKKFDVFQRIKYPSQNEEEIRAEKPSSLGQSRMILETLILVKLFLFIVT
jgi:hypothetical protein